jgi:hypothetical protein
LVITAFVVGTIAGLFWVFMLSMALGLRTEFTPMARIMAYVMCPALPVALLFPGAFMVTILLNGCLYALLAFFIAKLGVAASKRGTHN